MQTEDMIRDLNYVKHKYEGKPVFTGQVNIASMCGDVIRKLKELQTMADKNCGECSRRSWYQIGYADAAKEMEEAPGLPKEFLEDCKATAEKYKIKTHLDRVRNMSDIELADWLWNFFDQLGFASEDEIVTWLNTEVKYGSDR